MSKTSTTTGSLSRGIMFHHFRGENQPKAQRSISAELVKRMHLSLEFANSPMIDDVEKLKEYHVSAFVVNMSLTKMRD